MYILLEKELISSAISAVLVTLLAVLSPSAHPPPLSPQGVWTVKENVFPKIKYFHKDKRMPVTSFKVQVTAVSLFSP